MPTEGKKRIYKTCVRTILIYGSETRAEIAETKQILRLTEIKTLRTIKGVTLRDQIGSDNNKAECNVEDVVRWVRTRSRNWRGNVDRVKNEKWANWAKH